MAIVYDPNKMLRKIAPEAKIKRMMFKNLNVKKTALNFIDATEFIDKKSVSDVALKVVNSYHERVAREQADAGLVESAGDDLAKEISKDPKLLIQRVQNEVKFQVKNLIQTKYAGKKARWLPSGADEPRPLHQTAYGKIFIIGEGLPVGDDGSNVEPGDEYGCDCGMEILVDETELKLE